MTFLKVDFPKIYFFKSAPKYDFNHSETVLILDQYVRIFILYHNILFYFLQSKLV